MSKHRKFWAVLVGAMFLVPMVLSACGPTSKKTTTTGTIKNGGSVIDGLYEEPDTLLPMLTNETYSVIVDQALWAPLWYGDPQGQLHAGIATEVPSQANGDISSDLKTWKIKLRPGLKWSDGQPLTAADVAFSYNLYANPAFANTFGFPTTDPADPIGVQSITATDSNTVTIVLRNPDVVLLSLLADGASGPIPMHIFQSISPANIAHSPEYSKPSVVSGPFMIQSRVSGDSIVLVKNPNYYQPGLPHLNQLTFKIIPDQNTILTDLQSGSITESWFLDVTKQAQYKAISGYTTAQDSNPAGYEVLVFEMQPGRILSDPVIRQALTKSFDTSQLVTTLYSGAAKPTCDDSAGTFAHEPNLTCNQLDVAGANTMLTNDGWVMGSDGYRHKGGQTLELTYATTNKASREQTQLLAQAAWKSVGIKIDIKNYAANVFFGANANGILHSGSFDIGEFANTLGYDPDDHTFFMSTQTPDKGGSNYMHYSNPEVDTAENAQQQTADQTARKAAFHTIHTDVLKDNPVMYLFTAANIFVYSNHLHNYMPSAVGATEAWNVWDWYLDNV